jgi:hypothetical protein
MELYTVFVQSMCPQSFTAVQTVLAGGQSFIAMNVITIGAQGATYPFTYVYPSVTVTSFASLGHTIIVVSTPPRILLNFRTRSGFRPADSPEVDL